MTKPPFIESQLSRFLDVNCLSLKASRFFKELSPPAAVRETISRKMADEKDETVCGSAPEEQIREVCKSHFRSDAITGKLLICPASILTRHERRRIMEISG